VWVIPRPYPRRTAILLGECKDEGALRFADFEKDIENLRRVADAFPHKRFKTFLLFAKLSPFTEEEIRFAKTINENYRSRVILLTNRELEPYFLYERTMTKFGLERYASTPEDMAAATVKIYFKE
jgi:predicted ATPase